MPAPRLRRRRSPNPERLEITLELAPPASIEVGAGNVLSVGGTCTAGARQVRASHIRLGGRRVSTLAFEAHPLGARWAALIPIAAIEGPQSAELELEIAFEEGAARRLPLGTIELLPGTLKPSRPEPGCRTVAICLATYDPPLELLRRQLESIRAQSYEDWVCLISDDDSSEPVWDALNEMIDGDTRFRLSRSSVRCGLYRNFEKALKAVPLEVPYVAFCDQDDFWHPDKLASLVAALESSDVLVHSDARVVDSDGRELAPSVWPNRVPRDDDLRSLLLANAVTGASSLLRREVLDTALPFPAFAGDAYHDRWIALVASKLGGIVRIDRPLYDYVQHEQTALGHADVSGLDPPSPRLRGLVRRWRDGPLERSWRHEYFNTLLLTSGEATAIRLRLAARMSRAERRAGTDLERLGNSVRADSWLAIRAIVKKLRGGPGLETGLLRGILWRRLAGTAALPAEPGEDGA